MKETMKKFAVSFMTLPSRASSPTSSTMRPMASKQKCTCTYRSLIVHIKCGYHASQLASILPAESQQA